MVSKKPLRVYFRGTKMQSKIKVQKYKEPQFNRFSEYNTGDMLVKAGKVLAESFHAKGFDNQLKESFGIVYKEDVNTTTGAGAFTTMLSSVLYTAAVENIKDVLELVYINEDLKKSKGFGAYKIPRLQPTVAYEVAEGAVVNYFDDGVDSITVTPVKSVAGTAITWEIMERGMDDFVRFVLQNAADAVTRKLATDILNGLAAGASTTVTGGLSMANVLSAETNVNDASYSNGVKYGFLANRLAVSTTYFNTLRQDTDFKETFHFHGTVPGVPGYVVGNIPMMVGNLQIVVSPFLTAAQALVLDNRKAAMLVKESDLQTFEGHIPGRPYDREIVALMSYVLAVVYPKAISKIVA